MFEGLFQPMHLLVILIIALVVMGPDKLPALGSNLGKALRDFRKAMAETPHGGAVAEKRDAVPEKHDS